MFNSSILQRQYTFRTVGDGLACRIALVLHLATTLYFNLQSASLHLVDGITGTHTRHVRGYGQTVSAL